LEPSELKDLDLFELMAGNGDIMKIFRRDLVQVTRRPFAQTCHSLQGQTCNSRVYIHDIKEVKRPAPNLSDLRIENDNFINHTWVRTAISRATTSNIVIALGSSLAGLARSTVDAKITGHVATDTAKEYEWDPAAYVTYEWVKYKMRYQQFACFTCAAPLGCTGSEFSIDRISNKLPHTRRNCAIACLKCQAASCHRP
jgi:hypothetical protein